MAKSFGITAFTFELYPVGSRSHPTLDEVSAYKRIGAYLDERHNHLIKVESAADQHRHSALREKCSMRLVKLEPQESERGYAGLIRTGSYGSQLDIEDVESGEGIGRIEKHHAPGEPFYFMFRLPDGHRTRALLLGCAGRKSAGSVLRPDLAEYFRKQDLTARMKPLTDDEALRAYLAGGVGAKTLELTHLKRSADSRQVMAEARFNGEQLRVNDELRVVVKGKAVDAMMEVLRPLVLGSAGDGAMRDLVVVPGLDDPERARVQLRNADGKERWFNLFRPTATGVNFDVTDDVEFGPNSFPTFESMDTQARAIYDELRPGLS